MIAHLRMATLLLALSGFAAGCVATKRIDMAPQALREEVRAGAIVKAGDRITVISETRGALTFVVTEVDPDAIRGESVDVPIDEVVLLEKRQFAPLRTAGAIYGGTLLVGITALGVAGLILLL